VCRSFEYFVRNFELVVYYMGIKFENEPREALFNKSIITNQLENCCVFCFQEVENIHHIFFICSVIFKVWRFIFKWMGTKVLVCDNNHVMAFGDLCKGNNSKRFRHTKLIRPINATHSPISC
jgi:hypothetical protein